MSAGNTQNGIMSKSLTSTTHKQRIFMKKHEEILKEAHAQENDIKFWNLFFKAKREERQNVFESQLLPLLEKVYRSGVSKKMAALLFILLKLESLTFTLKRTRCYSEKVTDGDRTEREY